MHAWKFLTIYLFLIPFHAYAQSVPPPLSQKLNQWGITPIIGIQMWGSYTLGQKVYDDKSRAYQAVDNRLNFQLRRTRLGIKGSPHNNLFFNLTTSIDLVGRDLLAGTDAGGNNGGSPQLRLWNAYLQWRTLPSSEKLSVVVGYFPPQIGRASMTSAVRSTSMEKSWSQHYLRRHLVGTGPGRAMGLNVGGLLWNKDRLLNWRYDLGMFNPSFHAYGGNSAGKAYAPLGVARIATYVGEAEFQRYSLSRKVNHWGKRTGLTLAVAGAHQGASELFLSNSAWGIDFLLNLQDLNIDGEWTYLYREGSRMIDVAERHFRIRSQTGYLRMSYNLHLTTQYVLEPVIMAVGFQGETQQAKQLDAAHVGGFSGEEYIYNLGMNFYFSPNLKLSLHYTLRDGYAGEMGNGPTINNYFYQPGVGAIQRGDWLGMGLVAVF